MAKRETPAYHATELTMADRIRFQDELEVTLAMGGKISHVGGMTMDAKIHFQDKSDGRLMEKRP